MSEIENTIIKSPFWIVFFSQSGSEIAQVSRLLDRKPDLVITNHRPKHLRTFSQEFLDLNIPIHTVDNKPSPDDYFRVLKLNNVDPSNTLITLHGWLRVVPEEILKTYKNLYNGHPGLITKYPELKGKDPQEKAWKLGLQTSGCVIHQVTEGVDEGPVVFSSQEISIEGKSLEEIYTRLHTCSVTLWVDYLKRNWNF